MALAGSKPRGNQSRKISEMPGLVNSTKERHEHQFVVEAIRRRLEPITSPV